MTMGRYNHNS